jgi:hypothetical protein
MSLEKTKPFQIIPSSLKEAMELAKYIAESELAPKDYRNKVGNTLIAMQMGAEVGLAPIQAIQNIAVINGRPCVWGDAAIALVRASPNCESIREWIEGNIKDKSAVAYCEVKRRGEPNHVRRFSIEDATRAGLWNKAGPWQQYPERMLQMRARGFALRDVFPDVLKGLSLAEEVIDIPKEDYTVFPNVSSAKGTEGLKARLSALPKEESISNSPIEESKTDLKDLIAAATSVEELSEIGNLIAMTDDAEEKDELRGIYRLKLDNLRGESK